MLNVEEPVQTPTPPQEKSLLENPLEFANNLSADADLSRFNEENGPLKRRRIETSLESSPLESKSAAKVKLRKGPFLEDSEASDDEELSHVKNEMPMEIVRDTHSLDEEPTIPAEFPSVSDRKDRTQGLVKLSTVPSLTQERRIVVDRDDFEDIADFIDDEFPEEGEEYLERRWMEEQRQFEMDGEENPEPENKQFSRPDGVGDEGKSSSDEEVAASCPICGVGFDGLSDQVRSADSRYTRLIGDRMRRYTSTTA